MKRISLIFAAALALAGFAFAAKADDIDYSYLHMSDFGHKIKLQVSGYTGTETLQNFPVLVRLAEYDESTGKGIPGFDYDDMSAKNQGKATGKDLAFFDVQVHVPDRLAGHVHPETADGHDGFGVLVVSYIKAGGIFHASADHPL